MPKLLADYLQEQQEPFALEAYLVERGCSSRIGARCTTDRSAKHDPTDCWHFLRGVFSLFMVVVANADKKLGAEKANGGGDGVSTASSSTSLFNSCSESGSHCSEAAIRRFVKCGNRFMEGEVDADANLKLRAVVECKQLSPVSVLDENSPLHRFMRREVGNSCKSKQRIREEDPYAQYIIDKRALQLELREVTEKYTKTESKKRMQICSQESINIVHLLMVSIDEWDVEFEQQRLEILKEIENDILENACFHF